MLGRVKLPAKVVAKAAVLASVTWQDAVAAEFCGPAVETYSVPADFPAASKLVPDGTLAALGLAPNRAEEHLLVATYDVDSHQDSNYGLVLFLVLHNDGLTFFQGRSRHVTEAGEFFVFDDRLPHGVRGIRGPGVYLGWSIPVCRIDDRADAHD